VGVPKMIFVRLDYALAKVLVSKTLVAILGVLDVHGFSFCICDS